jgi:hypothetical protein
MFAAAALRLAAAPPGSRYRCGVHQFGDQTFDIIIDKGCSHTWVFETCFTCVDIGTTALISYFNK